MWIAPWTMTGPQLRQAAILPPSVRLAHLVVLVVLGGLTGWVDGSLDLSDGAAMASFLVVGLLIVLSLRRYAVARRIRFGLVQVPLPQFDLVMAMAQVAPEDVLEARRLHDQLLGALRDPARSGQVPAIEARMRELVPAGALAG